MAMTSGKMAAEAIVQAKRVNDFREYKLKQLSRSLYEDFIMKDLEKYKDATHTFENYPQYFNDYVPMMNKA